MRMTIFLLSLKEAIESFHPVLVRISGCSPVGRKFISEFGGWGGLSWYPRN